MHSIKLKEYCEADRTREILKNTLIRQICSKIVVNLKWLEGILRNKFNIAYKWQCLAKRSRCRCRKRHGAKDLRHKFTHSFILWPVGGMRSFGN